MTPDDRTAELEVENAALRVQLEELPVLWEQLATLATEVQQLRGRLAKDSHKSSKPPPSYGLGRKTRSLRRRSGKKPAGQLGHRGQTLRLVGSPDVAALSDEDRAAIRAMSEDEVSFDLHFGLGTYARNRCGLWQGNKALLAACASSPDTDGQFIHPDSASGVILAAL
jgi:hypothetical protein